MKFDGVIGAQDGWRLQEGGGPARRVAAFRNLRFSPARCHLQARMMGAWPVRLLETKSEIGSEWFLNYLIGFAAQLPLGQGPPASVSFFDSEELRRARERDAEGAAKRRQGVAGREKFRNYAFSRVAS